MKKKYLIFIGLFFLLALVICVVIYLFANNDTKISGKTFIYANSNIYYTDNRGNKIDFDKDSYDYSDIEKQKAEGYIVSNHYEYKYKYEFLSDSTVKYEYIKNDSIIKNEIGDYTIEDNIIKIKFDSGTKYFTYSKEENCLYDKNDIKYVIDK